MFRLKVIRISLGGMWILATINHVIMWNQNVETDISRYIQRQSPVEAKLAEWRLDPDNNMTTIIPSIQKASKTNLKQKENSFSETLDLKRNEASSFVYWNLSCPLELSMFSGAHMGGDFLHRAIKARKLAEESLGFHTIEWKSLENRRIFFVGDSLLRQVFISMACLHWDRVETYAVPWFMHRQVRGRHPNTIRERKVSIPNLRKPEYG
jgi:hypothetical protein